MPDSQVVDAGRLRLVFSHAVDRWSHSIAVAVDGEWQTLLSSVEGGAADPWPPSPAFQDLRLETIDQTTQEFQLMGQCGTGVYSAAIRCDLARSTIDFDVCLRVRRPKRGHVAGETSSIQEDIARSTYRCVSPAELSHSPVVLTIHLPNAPGNLAIRLHSPVAVAIAVDRVDGTDQVLLRGPQRDNDPQTTKSLAQNLRWRYFISLESTSNTHLSVAQ